jgi:hypothetical protein
MPGHGARISADDSNERLRCTIVGVANAVPGFRRPQWRSFGDQRHHDKLQADQRFRRRARAVIQQEDRLRGRGDVTGRLTRRKFNHASLASLLTAAASAGVAASVRQEPASGSSTRPNVITQELPSEPPRGRRSGASARLPSVLVRTYPSRPSVRPVGRGVLCRLPHFGGLHYSFVRT